MKKLFLASSLLALFASGQACAQGYTVTESSGQPRQITVTNDGRRTYIQAVPGLVIPFGTNEGDRYVVNGTPSVIAGKLNGQSISISQNTGAPRSNEADILNRVKALEAELLAKETKARLGAPGVWEIRPEDLSIYAALRRWAKVANWQISWEIPVDYPATILDRSSGTFEQAIDRVMTAYSNADYPPKGCFHANNVVRIVRRVGDGQECKQ